MITSNQGSKYFQGLVRYSTYMLNSEADCVVLYYTWKQGQKKKNISLLVALLKDGFMSPNNEENQGK